MANEYLKRTPTSTGNRKVFTWAAWLKKNEIAVSFGRLFEVGADVGNRSYFTFRDFDELEFVHRDSATNTDQIISDLQFRDPGSFAHFMIAANSTASTETDRIKIYVNGVLLTKYSTSNFPVINQEFDVNSLVGHYLGNSVNQAADLMGVMTDVFFVDGQALTPDVFGFYKEGKGYISAGSTQATDFRPGQWVPKAPRTIKSEINRRGGFGVNGFYLPMNDSSNFGADFHTTPNSIITLKGENLPQPRNGAPDTTDAYVSQLRTDPYAANLVLAVPGISTSTGPELVTNGDFSNGTNGWTLGTATGTLSVVSGELFIEYASTNGTYCTQTITTEVGKSYKVSVTSRTTTTNQPAKFSIGTASNTSDLTARIDNNDTTNKIQTASFVATTTTTHLALGANFTSDAYFDNVSVREEAVPIDYSADIKGSGTNKTLTVNGGAGIADIPSYYGSALSFDGSDDYFTLPANTSDLLLGSSDFTIECWVNKTNSGQQDVYGLYQTANNRRSYLLVTTDTETVFYLNETGSSGINATANVVTPLNQWTHIAAERYGSNLTLYINGVAGAANTTANFTAYNNTVDSFMIGASDYSIANGSEFTGYIQDLRIYKGVAKYKGGFDVPKPYTPVGIATWRAVPDTTANNFTTMSPLVEARPSSGSNTNHASSIITFADGNLSLTNASSSGNAQKMIAFSSVGFSTGKWYYEEITGSNGRLCLTKGIQQLQYGLDAGAGAGVEALVRINASDGVISIANTAYYSTATPANLTAESFDTTNVMGVAIDASLGKNNLTVQFYKDGVGIATLTGIGATSPVEEWFPTKLPRSSGSADEAYFNFGQNPTFSGNTTAGTYTDGNGKGLFKYQPPSGFLALCEDNLPTPAIADPGEHFKTVLYTGDASNGRSITGVGFKPDLIWFKGRNAAVSHVINDTVRGVTEHLNSNTTSAASIPGFPYLNSVDNDGFSLLGGTSSGGNISGRNYVAWCWKAGGAAVSNTDGSITSQVSANQTAGFSIVSYTGSGSGVNETIGHGLGKTPKFIITKSRDETDNWIVYHNALTPGTELRLNSTVSFTSFAQYTTTTPTSSVYSISGAGAMGGDGEKIIAYCWAEIEGFSKFGSYVGNGNADGPFVYCGFKPAVVIQKIITDTNNWIINDSSINSTNPSTVGLRLNTNGQEIDSLSNILDFCSNGFKIRGAGSVMNTANETYIFAAFAESPFQTANAK